MWCATDSVAALEADYDSVNWSRKNADGGGWGLYSIKHDGYDSCDRGGCHSHVGEPIYEEAPMPEHYGDGWYVDEWGHKLARSGIPLIEEHWRAPCP